MFGEFKHSVAKCVINCPVSGLTSLAKPWKRSGKALGSRDWMRRRFWGRSISNAWPTRSYRKLYWWYQGGNLFGFYGLQDEKGAVEIWEKLATSEEGSPEGKLLWGFARFSGYQCRKDVTQGIPFIREAAEKRSGISPEALFRFEWQSKSKLFSGNGLSGRQPEGT